MNKYRHASPRDYLEAILERLDILEATIMTIGSNTQTALNDLATAVASDTAAVNAAIALLQTLAADLAAIGTQSDDPAIAAAIEAQVSTINSGVSSLQAAVTANTPPAAPAPTGGGSQ